MPKFFERLKALGFGTYEEYLESDHWKEFKRCYRTSDLPQACVVCGGTERIELHHHTYLRLGAELSTDVDPLCRSHHEAVHEWLRASDSPFVENTHKAIYALKGNRVEVASKKQQPQRKESAKQTSKQLRQHEQCKRAAADALTKYRELAGITKGTTTPTMPSVVFKRQRIAAKRRTKRTGKDDKRR